MKTCGICLDYFVYHSNFQSHSFSCKCHDHNFLHASIVCVCLLYVWLCVFGCAHLCVCVWELETDFWCLLLQCSTLWGGVSGSHRTGTCHFWLTANTCLYLPRGGLQLGPRMPCFYVGSGESNLGFHSGCLPM